RSLSLPRRSRATALLQAVAHWPPDQQRAPPPLGPPSEGVDHPVDRVPCLRRRPWSAHRSLRQCPRTAEGAMYPRLETGGCMAYFCKGIDYARPHRRSRQRLSLLPSSSANCITPCHGRGFAPSREHLDGGVRWLVNMCINVLECVHG